MLGIPCVEITPQISNRAVI